jgi:nitric oxide reductase subunit B
MAFVLYFTGLTNLMFNWGHHIYTLPTHHYIQYVSYAISMTELFIFGRIIYTWRTTVSTAERHFHILSFRMFTAADIWIFLNLLQAIVMSIPAINVYTHGTHFTVAHTMGATIGINSFLLLSFAFDMLHDSDVQMKPAAHIAIKLGFWIANIALFIFWLSLIFAGIAKAHWQMLPERTAFNTMMEQLKPYFVTILNAGMVLIAGFLMMLYPLIKNLFKAYLRTEE